LSGYLEGYVVAGGSGTTPDRLNRSAIAIGLKMQLAALKLPAKL